MRTVIAATALAFAVSAAVPTFAGEGGCSWSQSASKSSSSTTQTAQTTHDDVIGHHGKRRLVIIPSYPSGVFVGPLIRGRRCFHHFSST